MTVEEYLEVTRIARADRCRSLQFDRQKSALALSDEINFLPRLCPPVMHPAVGRCVSPHGEVRCNKRFEMKARWLRLSRCGERQRNVGHEELGRLCYSVPGISRERGYQLDQEAALERIEPAPDRGDRSAKISRQSIDVQYLTRARCHQPHELLESIGGFNRKQLPNVTIREHLDIVVEQSPAHVCCSCNCPGKATRLDGRSPVQHAARRGSPFKLLDHTWRVMIEEKIPASVSFTQTKLAEREWPECSIRGTPQQ